MNKKLSIIVVHYRKPPILRLCLKSLQRSIANTDYEIIVSDSASSEESRDVLIEEFPEVRFIPFEENTGYSKGVNAGIGEAKGEYIFVLNPDTVVYDDSISKMTDLLENNKDIGVVGPALLNWDGSRQQSCFRFYKPITVICRRTMLGKLPGFRKYIESFLLRDKDLSKQQDVDWIMGAAMMMRKKDLERIGLMDERFFMYFEDVDWCRRFWENGLRVVYYPEAKIHHYLGRGSNKGFAFIDLLLGKLSRWHLASGLKYFIKYGV